jgi:hypothetical protein
VLVVKEMVVHVIISLALCVEQLSLVKLMSLTLLILTLMMINPQLWEIWEIIIVQCQEMLLEMVLKHMDFL